MTAPSTERRRIAVLPDHLANKIAAGEVIQRPDSVVKELVENAMDAGATSLQIVVRDGGKEYIQVTDDGIGMDEQDAVLSFLRHATSKIATYDELEAIRTYGFRGEALASIAAVAQVTMKTRRHDDDMAVIVKVAGEARPVVTRDGAAKGTSVIVQNLFFNVPARRKFLKSTNTEFRHIFDVVQRTAIAHPACAIEFVSDGEVVFRLRPSSLEERLVEVFGQRAFEAMIPLQESTDFLAVSGYIGKPQFGQKSRSGQYLFLNKRFIVSRNVSHGVHSAYEHLLTKGSFPFFLLFLEIDPHRIDVNVHPSKMEAKFDDEQGVHRFIASLTRKALASANAIPALTAGDTGDPGDIGLRFTARQHMWTPTERGTDQTWEFPARDRVDTRTGEILPRQGASTAGAEGSLFGAHTAPVPSPATTAAPAAGVEEGSSLLLWQLHDRYIFSQIRNGVMIVDQHVAHERILYERALAMFDNGMRSSQQLLFPVTVELTPGDFALFTELLPHFAGLGFDAKPFGKQTVLVEGVPVDVKPGHEQHILQEILEQYKEYQHHAPMDVRDNMANAHACRSAIKSGDPLTEKEMRSLIDQLFATSMPYVCPHGRPVVLRISTEELDRRFGRT